MKRFPTRTLLLLCFCVTFLTVAAQDGYQLNFRIEGLRDTTVYLGYFLQEKTMVRDTARCDQDGRFEFDGKARLPEGLYFIVVQNSRLFDFVIGRDQQFSIETRHEDYLDHMVVKGDEDNLLFLESMRLNASYSRKSEPLVKIIRDSLASDDEKSKARTSLQEMNTTAISKQEELIRKSPGSVTARLMLMNKPITVPDPPKDAGGKIDSTYYLRYYREHYFDHVDLGDELMLRVPKIFYWEKVKDYLGRLYLQHPDTITTQIYKLAEIAKRNKETYKYLIWKCLSEYQYHEIMGLNEVYVNVVDKYVATGEMDYWLDKRTVSNLKDQADQIRKAMIGRKGPNVILQDVEKQPRALYDIRNKYTIIFYFSPDCGHCRTQTPRLVRLYETTREKFDFDVYGVAPDTSLTEIKRFVEHFNIPWVTVSGPRTYTGKSFTDEYYVYNTPTIYILDREKNVIARHIPIDQIVDFLERHEAMLRRRKAADMNAGG